MLNMILNWFPIYVFIFVAIAPVIAIFLVSDWSWKKVKEKIVKAMWKFLGWLFKTNFMKGLIDGITLGQGGGGFSDAVKKIKKGDEK